MRVQDGTRQPVPMSALTTPEALQRAGQVLSVPDKTPENILKELSAITVSYNLAKLAYHLFENCFVFYMTDSEAEI